jgi:hypothetical protein
MKVESSRYFFPLFVGLNNFLLAVLNYENAVAICHSCIKQSHEAPALWIAGAGVLGH